MEMYLNLTRQLVLVYKNGSERDEFIWKKIDGLDYGFKYRRDYSGYMANHNDDLELLKKRPKLGLFDILVFTETNDYKMTHKKLIKRLLQFSNISNCERVWGGEDPGDFSEGEELKALSILALFMFEQEMNWGDEIYQKRSYFSPKVGARPRDMLMGFIHMFFILKNIDSYEFWKKETPIIPPYPVGYSYFSYPEKNFFEYYKKVPLDNNKNLISGNVQKYMYELARQANNHPDIQKYNLAIYTNIHTNIKNK